MFYLLDYFCANESKTCKSSSLGNESFNWCWWIPKKHKALVHCWFNVGPPSTTFAQHWSNIGSMSCIRLASTNKGLNGEDWFSESDIQANRDPLDIDLRLLFTFSLLSTVTRVGCDNRRQSMMTVITKVGDRRQDAVWQLVTRPTWPRVKSCQSPPRGGCTPQSNSPTRGGRMNTQM